MPRACNSNNVYCGETSRFHGDVWAAMDRLPQALRRMLHEMTIEHDPREVRWHLNKLIKAGVDPAQAEKRLIEYYLKDEDAELRDFAYTWPSRFGRYPAAAAQASILRYAGTRETSA